MSATANPLSFKLLLYAFIGSLFDLSVWMRQRLPTESKWVQGVITTCLLLLPLNAMTWPQEHADTWWLPFPVLISCCAGWAWLIRTPFPTRQGTASRPHSYTPCWNTRASVPPVARLSNCARPSSPSRRIFQRHSQRFRNTLSMHPSIYWSNAGRAVLPILKPSTGGNIILIY